MLRNAEISQQMELVKQEKRRQETELSDLAVKVAQLEDDSIKHKETRIIEQQLRKNISELEEQISDKNKVLFIMIF